MGKTIGIDLGTTNSVAAFKLAAVEVVTAPDNKPPDRKLTPSVVAWQQNQLVVGKDAFNQLKASPENVIISIKRLMGRGFADPVVQQQLSHFGYRITASEEGTENSLAVCLADQQYTPEAISAAILKKVINNAQEYQSQTGQQGTITQAVITIPAYFNDKQRYATQKAAAIAGLVSAELLPEPTAAAISYGFKPNSDEVKTLLVYDFGGGTFDSSLITASGNQFIESSKAGDLWLGGDDFDGLIIKFVKEQVASAEGIEDIDGLIAKMPHYQRLRFLADLKIAAEQAKIDLSTQTVTHVIPSTPLLDEFGMTIDIDVEITREQFEQMILPLVDRSVAICLEAVKYSEFPMDMIDIVLLVGGSSQIPLVQSKLKQAFGQEKVVVHPRPMYAVAEGAAIVAAGLTERVGTVSRDYFIELVENKRYPIIKQGDLLPVTNLHTFRTEADDQRLIHFKFYSPDLVREDLDHLRQDERIGDMWLVLDDSYPKGTEILVTVELDEKNNSLQITASLKNNPSVTVSSNLSRGEEDEKISREVEKSIQEVNESGKFTPIGVKRFSEIAATTLKNANQIRDKQGRVQSDRTVAAHHSLQELQAFTNEDLQDARFFLREFDFILKYCSSQLSAEQAARIQTLTQALQTAVDTNNFGALNHLTAEAQREFDNLPDAVSLILMCQEGIARANHSNPTHANAMNTKFFQMLHALERGDTQEANSWLQELLLEIRPYLDQEIPTGTIATGLTR